MSFYNTWVNNKNNTLDNRMRSLVVKNNKNCHGFKPFIVSVKSKQLMSHISHLTSFSDKVKLLKAVQDILFESSKVIYKRYNPHLIYTFQNEINIVFFYNDQGNFVYNGNINKIITGIVSCISIEVYKRLFIELDFTGQFVEFDIDYEILNYLVWRQMDCRRNIVTLLYKCYNMNHVFDDTVEVDGLKNEYMIGFLNEDMDNSECITERYKSLLTGNIIKKYVFRKRSESDSNEIIIRKSVGVDHFYFSQNFKETLSKYIENPIIEQVYNNNVEN